MIPHFFWGLLFFALHFFCVALSGLSSSLSLPLALSLGFGQAGGRGVEGGGSQQRASSISKIFACSFFCVAVFFALMFWLRLKLELTFSFKLRLWASWWERG